MSFCDSLVGRSSGLEGAFGILKDLCTTGVQAMGPDVVDVERLLLMLTPLLLL